MIETADQIEDRLADFTRGEAGWLQAFSQYDYGRRLVDLRFAGGEQLCAQLSYFLES